MKLNISDKCYDILKRIVATILPFVDLISALSTIWGFAYGPQVTATLTAIHAFLGAVLKIACDTYNAEE